MVTGDIATTYLILNQENGIEFNVLMSPIVGNIFLHFAIKCIDIIIVIGIALIIIHSIKKKNADISKLNSLNRWFMKFVRIEAALLVFIIWYTYIDASNLAYLLYGTNIPSFYPYVWYAVNP